MTSAAPPLTAADTAGTGNVPWTPSQRDSHILALLRHSHDEEKLAGLILYCKNHRTSAVDSGNEIANQYQRHLAEAVFAAVTGDFLHRLLVTAANTSASNASTKTLLALIEHAGIDTTFTSDARGRLSGYAIVGLHAITLLSQHLNVAVSLIPLFRDLASLAVNHCDGSVSDPLMKQLIEVVAIIIENATKSGVSVTLNLSGSIIAIAGNVNEQPALLPLLRMLMTRTMPSTLTPLNDELCQRLTAVAANNDTVRYDSFALIAHAVHHSKDDHIVSTDASLWLDQLRVIISDELRSKLLPSERRRIFELLDTITASYGVAVIVRPPKDNTNTDQKIDEFFFKVLLVSLRVEIPLLLLEPLSLSDDDQATLRFASALARRVIGWLTDDTNGIDWSTAVIEAFQSSFKAIVEAIIIYSQEQEAEHRQSTELFRDMCHLLAVWLREDNETLKTPITPMLGHLLRDCGDESLIPLAEALTPRVHEAVVCKALSQTAVLHRYAAVIDSVAIQALIADSDSDDSESLVLLLSNTMNEIGVVSDMLRSLIETSTGVNRSAIVVELASEPHCQSLLATALALAGVAKRHRWACIVDSALRLNTLMARVLILSQPSPIPTESSDQWTVILHGLLAVVGLALSLAGSIESDVISAQLDAFVGLLQTHPSLRPSMAAEWHSQSLPQSLSDGCPRALQAAMTRWTRSLD